MAQYRSGLGWISRRLITTPLSIVVFLVSVLMMVMIATLNSDVRPLYGQIVYCDGGEPFHCYRCSVGRRLLIFPAGEDNDHRP